MEQMAFDEAFMYAYSMRARTHAYHKMEDDVPLETKKRRLQEVIDMFRNKRSDECVKYLDSKQLVLIEGRSRRSTDSNPQWSGRTDGNKIVVVDDKPVSASLKAEDMNAKVTLKPGDYVLVQITEAGPSTLKGEPLARTDIVHANSILLEDSLLRNK